MSSDRRLCPDRHWSLLEWIQETFFNSYHHIRTRLDQKIEIDEKFSKFFPSVTNFLKVKSTIFRFSSNSILGLTLKYRQRELVQMTLQSPPPGVDHDVSMTFFSSQRYFG